MKSNYLKLGPVTIRVSRKHLASWGYPLVQIGGLSLLSHDNTGRLHLAAYHPRSSLTWHWFVSLYRSPDARRGAFNLQRRKGHGERGISAFGWTLSINEQAYHKDRRRLAIDRIEAAAAREYREGVSAGAAARQLCRTLGCNGDTPTLKRLLEDLLADANRANYDRRRILRDFEAAAPAAAKKAAHASFVRNNPHLKETEA